MGKSILLILLAVVLQATVTTARADRVILKSGEMFQTRKAWREDGSVYFYHNGKVVRYPEGQVERMIGSAPPAIDKPETPDSPSTIFKERSAPPEPQKSPPVMTSGGNVGYLGLKWQQPVAQVKGASPAGSDPAYGGVKLYSLNTRRFGRASVDGVFFGILAGGAVYGSCSGEQLSGFFGFDDGSLRPLWKRPGGWWA